MPQPTDIDIDLATPTTAVTRWSEVPADPANYWHWMHWGPTSVRDTEANTQAVITHELVHAKQIHGWWQDWQRASTRPRAIRGSSTWRRWTNSARWHGPQELEAYATGLDFLPKLSRAERSGGVAAAVRRIPEDRAVRAADGRDTGDDHGRHARR